MTPRKIAGWDCLGRQTASANTAILALVPPSQNYRTRIDELVYTAGATAHLLTVMQELGRTTVATAAGTGQAVINLAAQPNGTDTVAGSDYMAWDNGDGTYSFDLVASVATLAITMTNNLPKALAVGQTVWLFGTTTDLVPKSPTGLAGAANLAHPSFTLKASTRQAFPTNPSMVGGFVCSPPGLRFSPLLAYVDNVTNAGVLELIRYCHTD